MTDITSALVGGLIGSILTTLAQPFLIARLEREQWLRGEKHRAYTSFVRFSNAFKFSSKARLNEDLIDAHKLVADIRILALSPKVQNLLQSYVASLQTFGASVEQVEDVYKNKNLKGLFSDLENCQADLTEALHEDLVDNQSLFKIWKKHK